MCPPVIAAASLAMTVIGTATSVMGQMQAGTYLPYVADPQLCYTSKLWD